MSTNQYISTLSFAALRSTAGDNANLENLQTPIHENKRLRSDDRNAAFPQSNNTDQMMPSQAPGRYQNVAVQLQDENTRLSDENAALRQCLMLTKQNCEVRTLNFVTSALAACDDKLRKFMMEALLTLPTRQIQTESQSSQRIDEKRAAEDSNPKMLPDSNKERMYPKSPFKSYSNRIENSDRNEWSETNSIDTTRQITTGSISGRNSPSYGNSFAEIQLNELDDTRSMYSNNGGTTSNKFYREGVTDRSMMSDNEKRSTMNSNYDQRQQVNFNRQSMEQSKKLNETSRSLPKTPQQSPIDFSMGPKSVDQPKAPFESTRQTSTITGGVFGPSSAQTDSQIQQQQWEIASQYHGKNIPENLYFQSPPEQTNQKIIRPSSPKAHQFIENYTTQQQSFRSNSPNSSRQAQNNEANFHTFVTNRDSTEFEDSLEPKYAHQKKFMTTENKTTAVNANGQPETLGKQSKGRESTNSNYGHYDDQNFRPIVRPGSQSQPPPNSPPPPATRPTAISPAQVQRFSATPQQFGMGPTNMGVPGVSTTSKGVSSARAYQGPAQSLFPTQYAGFPIKSFSSQSQNTYKSYKSHTAPVQNAPNFPATVVESGSTLPFASSSYQEDVDTRANDRYGHYANDISSRPIKGQNDTRFNAIGQPVASSTPIKIDNRAGYANDGSTRPMSNVAEQRFNVIGQPIASSTPRRSPVEQNKIFKQEKQVNISPRYDQHIYSTTTSHYDTASDLSRPGSPRPTVTTNERPQRSYNRTVDGRPRTPTNTEIDVGADVVGNPIATSTQKSVKQSQKKTNGGLRMTKDSLAEVMGLGGEGAREKANYILYRPVDTLTGYRPSFTSDTMSSIAQMKPNRRLMGEIAFQLDRRILEYVFTGTEKVSSKKKRSRYYGYSLTNISELIRKEASRDGVYNDQLDKLLRNRVDKILQELRPLGYTMETHAEFTQDVINKYGLMNGKTDQNIVDGFGLTDPSILRILIGKVFRRERQRQHMLIILDCLCLLAFEDGRPMLMW